MSPLKISAITGFLAFMLSIPLVLGVSLFPLINDLQGVVIYILVIIGLATVTIAALLIGTWSKLKTEGLQQKTVTDKLIFWGIIILILGIFLYLYAPRFIR